MHAARCGDFIGAGELQTTRARIWNELQNEYMAKDLSPGALRHSDARGRLLENDRSAAHWHTYKPTPQQIAYTPRETGLPFENYGVDAISKPRGSDRWVAPPHVRPIDDQLQSFGQLSPRRRAAHVTPSMADSAMSVGMGTVGSFATVSSNSESPSAYHRRNFEKVQNMDANHSPRDTYGVSLALPSMDGLRSHRQSPTGESNDSSQNLSPSPYRRGANFVAQPDGSGRNHERNFWPMGMASPSPAVGEPLRSFEQWMSAQSSPVARVSTRTSFAERMHAEAQAQEPTPFTKSTQLSPRAASFPRPGFGPEPTRSHHHELWPVGERTNHPRLGANSERIQPHNNIPTISGIEAAALDKSPSGFRHQSTDVTNACGGKGWSVSTVRDSLTDAGYTLPPPVPGGASPGGSPEFFRRGRSDLAYIENPRTVRSQYFARERATADGVANLSYRRQLTGATHPGAETQRDYQMGLAAQPQADLGYSRGISDIHGDIAARDFRMRGSL